MKSEQPLKTIAYLISILVVIALAWTLRLRAVNLLPVDFDEDDYLRAGQEFANLIRTGDWSGFLDTNYRPEHPPLAKYVFGLSILGVPEHPLIPEASTTDRPNESLPQALLKPARNAAAIMGTLQVTLLALVNPFAGLLLAVHALTIKYTSQVMLESLPALTSLAAVLAYVRFKKKGAFGWLLASAIFLGLTAASKYLHAFVGFAIMVDWYIEANRKNNLNRFYKGFLMFGVVSVFVFFAANPYLWPDPLGRLQESLFYHTSYSGNAQEVQNASFPFWQPFNWLFFSMKTWHPTQFLFVVDVWITLLAFLGIGRLWKREPVYVWWLVIMMGFLLIWPTKWPQYIVALSAPLSLAAGEGVLFLWNGLRDWWKERRAAPTKRSTVSDLRRALPWLVPGLIAFAVLTLFPLLFQFAVSLTDFNVSSIRDGFQGGIWRAVSEGLTGQVSATPVDIETRSNQVNYVGLGAYPAVFSFITGSADGWSILFFNILWTLLSVLLQGALGLGVALLLWQRGVQLSKFWQTFFILPWAIPEMIGATMWLNVFERDWGWLALAADQYGPESVFGRLAAYSDSSPSFWLVTFLIPAVWYGFPFMMLAASVGLKAVPRPVFDAAAIDGANSFQTFRYITWPLLLPLLLPAVVIRGIFAFNQFYLFQVFFFQQATLATLSYNIFNPTGFGSSGQFALSATINIIAVIILIGFIVLFNRWSKAEEGVSYA